MSAKKLPKAIRRTTGELPPDPARQGTTDEEAPTAIPEQPVQQPSSALSSDADSDVAGRVPQPASSPVEERAALPERSSADDMAARRRSLAYRMVERYAAYSGGVGVIPLPVANVAGVMAINIRMVQVLCNIYGVPFRRDRTRAVLVGLAGGATPTGLAAATSSTLAYLTPATTIIALAVSSVTAVACTRRIGRVFVEHFESGGTVE